MKIHKYRKRVLVVCLLIIGIFLFRLFLFDPYKVSSSSMSPVVKEGDWIIISKSSYGARIPRNYDEIPFGLFFEVLFKSKPKFRWDLKTYTRMPGFGGPHRNDIILLKNPQNLIGLYIKRIVGIPGEKIIIRPDSVLIYSSDVLSQPNIGFGLSKTYSTSDSSWVINIPEKGKYINLDSVTSPHLLDLLAKFENLDIDLASLKNSHHAGIKYKIKLNYYFVLGDNINMSVDSRSYGLIPETCILGKAIFNVSKFRSL